MVSVALIKGGRITFCAMPYKALMEMRKNVLSMNGDPTIVVDLQVEGGETEQHRVHLGEMYVKYDAGKER